MRIIPSLINGFFASIILSILVDAIPADLRSTLIMLPFFTYLFYEKAYKDNNKKETDTTMTNQEVIQNINEKNLQPIHISIKDMHESRYYRVEGKTYELIYENGVAISVEQIVRLNS